MNGTASYAVEGSPDLWLPFIMGWALLALVIGAVIMLVINLLQNPPWPQRDDPPGSSK
jgi:TRAP-type C4-dicarboxylate transport system permease small subunit